MNEREIFDAALQIPGEEARSNYLRQACGNDDQLREQIEGLLRAEQLLGSFLAMPLPALAGTLDMPAEPPVTAAPGTVIGPYKLLQQIGEGGMGVVYMAEQATPVRRKVALKIIKPGMDTREVIARFEAERQALALMDHPSIAHVFDGGATQAGRPYFVMELVRGVPITDYCDQNNLPIHERLELFVTVCHAVQHAHQKGIIHRDIKPSNVLVTLHDGRPVPKVIDFGVAKAIGPQLTDKTLFTQFAQMVGTPLYMSPEQAELTGLDVDTRGDIYSLGVLLYELLTGTTPFEQARMKKAALEEIRRMIREEDPPSPSIRLSSTVGEAQTAVAARRRIDHKGLSRLVRGDLDKIVMKALEKDRARRYETANGFADDVVRYLSDEPVQACPPSALYRLRKFTRRNRAAITTAALLATALVVGTAISTWLAIRATRAEQLAQHRLQEETAARNDAETARSDAEAARTAEAGQRNLAEVQRVEAVKMRNQAEANFGLARRAVDDMYTQVAEKWLATQPKMEGVQREFLTKALQFYTDFAQDTSSDPQLRVEVAKAFRRVADIQHKLGNPAEAERAFQHAVDRLQALADEFPYAAEYRQSLAEALHNMGVLVGDTNRYPEEEQFHRRALSLQESLAAEFPQVPEYRRDLARGHFFVGTLLASLKRRPEAEQEYRKALALQSALVAEFPTEPVYRENLAASYRNLAETVVWLNRRDEHLAALREALALQESLVADFPTVPTYRNELAGTRYWLAVGLPLAEAEPYIRQALSLQEKLAAEYPAVTDYRYDLMRSYQFLGRILRLTNRSEQAIETLTMATVIGDKLVADSPEMYYYADRLGNIYTTLAQLCVAAGRLEEAKRSYDRALTLMNTPNTTPEQINAMAWLLATAAVDRLVDAARAVELARKATGLAPQEGNYWNTFGVACYRAGDWRGAIAALEKSMQLRGGGDGNDWFFLAMAHWQLGERDLALKWFNVGDLWTSKNGSKDVELVRFRTEAVKLLGATEHGMENVNDLAIGQALVDANPIASSYIYRGRIYAEMDQLDRADVDYTRAMELGENAVNPWYERALVRLARDNILGYKSDCAEIIKRFRQSDQPQSWGLQAWTCSLAPNAIPDLSLALALAEKSVQSDAKSAFHITTLGAILYRLGRFDEAARKLDDANRIAQPSDVDGSPVVYRWFFLAMTHRHLQHPDEAQKWLDRALEKSNQLLENPEAGAAKLPWTRRLTIKLLRKEAEAFIRTQ